VVTEEVVTGYNHPLEETAAFAVLASRYQLSSGRWVQGGQVDLLLDDPDHSTPTVWVDAPTPDGSRAYVTVAAAFAIPTIDDRADSAQASPWYLPVEYEPILIADAAAAAIQGRDLSAATQEYITQALEAEGFPVGSGVNIRNQLLGYRNMLVADQVRKLKARWRPQVYMNPVAYGG
jgi:hypothetical protein